MQPLMLTEEGGVKMTTTNGIRSEEMKVNYFLNNN